MKRDQFRMFGEWRMENSNNDLSRGVKIFRKREPCVSFLTR